MSIIEEVQKTAEKVAKRETQTFSEAASHGDTVRQGDVYITWLESLPEDVEAQQDWDAQLAPGNTQGSRHILDSKNGVTCYKFQNPTEFDGPMLVLTEERTVTHPEHGNWVLPPGIYYIGYQQTEDMLEQRRRVED